MKNILGAFFYFNQMQRRIAHKPQKKEEQEEKS